MRSCRDITALVSQGLDKKLSLGERLAIGVHVMMCSRCRNFQSQTRFIRRAAKGYIANLHHDPDKKTEI